MPTLDFHFGRSLALLAAGALSSLSAGSLSAGEVRSFPLPFQTVLAEEITAEAPVFFRAMRFNEANEQWNVDLVVTNQGERSFTQALFLTVDSFSNTTGPLAFDGVSTNPSARSFFRIEAGGVLAPGKVSPPRTIALGFVGGAGAPRMQIRVYGVPAGMSHALALTRTLNGVGQPLAGVRVTERGPIEDRLLFTDPDYGVVTLGQSQGEHTWKFERDGHLPVWRKETLLRGAVRLVPNPRLVRRNTNSTAIAERGSGIVADPAGNVRLDFSFERPGDSAVVTLTMVDGQTLPGPLPQGWSPLRAFWVESTNAPLEAVVAMKPEGSIAPTDTAALVKWNVDNTQWQVQARLTPDGTNVVLEILENWGAYALVVADSGSLAPPLPVDGQPLLPSTPPLQPAPAFAASGAVTPSSSPASRISEHVTATASVLITNSTGLLPSGLTLRTEVTEDYRLQDSSTRFMALYETFVTAYRRPADTTPRALSAAFPMRPLLLFGGDELAEASVRVEVLSPDIFRGGVFDLFGGSLTNGRVRVVGAPGDFATPQAALLRSLTSTNLPALLIPGQTIAAAFDLTVAGVEPGHSLSLQVSNLAPNRFFILSRILSGTSFNGLEPIERLRSGTNGVLTSLEPATGERLPGLRGAGQYLLVQVSSPHGLISGITRNAQSQPAVGLPIHITGQPWLTFSASNGAYRLVAPTGAVQVAATDLSSGDTDFVDSTIVDPDSPLALDLGTSSRGPRVASVSPAPGSRNVNRVTPIAVTFSQPLNPGTVVGEGLRLLGTNGLAVTASLTLNQRGTIATLLPANPLGAGQTFTLVLSSNITDLTARLLEGPTQFTFTTVSEAARGDVAKLTIFQPGATNLVIGTLAVRALLVGFDAIPEKRNTIVAYGSPGTAEAEVPVILVNESSGETATVLSKVDGSFAGFVRASEEDFISAVFVNANGTRTTVPASLQRFDDGRLGLYRSGGILEAESDGGPVQVIVEPGAIESRTLFKIDPLTIAQFTSQFGNTPPAGGGKVVGGFNYTETGDPVTVAADVNFPVNVGDLGLPANLPPEQATYVVVTPHNFGGTTVYQIVDRADFKSTGAGTGRIVTRSPPFVGLLAQSLAKIRENIGLPDLSPVVTRTATEQNPHKGESAVFGIIALPFSQGVTVGGRVVSFPVDAAGNPDGEGRPVPGALVRLEQEQAGVLASIFSEGEMLAGADLDGNFGFVLRPSGAGNSFNLIATHPRFPFQRARAAGLTPPADATTSLRAELRFAEVSANGTVTGTQPPEVQLSHAPLLPSVGLNGDGALVTVVAIDDGQVEAPSLELVRIESPDRAPLNLTNAQAPSQVIEQRSAPGRVSRQFRVKAAVPSRIILKARAADDSGQQREVDYTVVFGGLAVGTGPGDTNDIRGPRVVFSWPPQNAPSIPALTPIVVRFNEPVPEGFLLPQNLAWLSLDPTHFLRGIDASADRREILVRYEGRTDNEVRLSVGAGLTDTRQNSFDQNPAEPGAQSFDLKFTQLPPRTAALTESSSGGGAALLGRYAYALDRSGGRLLSYDLENPSEPELEDTLALEGFLATLTPVPGLVLPKDIVLSGTQATANGSLTNSYVAVFTGGATDAKQLHLVRVEEGELDDTQTGTLTLNPAAQIVKSKWDPPFMGYFELGADVTSISLINMTAFEIGTRSQFSNLTFPTAGDAGLDADRNGSFCDFGDRLPLPSRRTDEAPGLAFSYAPVDPQQRIQDFDFDGSLGLVVATHMPVGTGGQGNLRVVLAATSPLSLTNAIVKFDPGLRPKRVTLLAALPLQVSNSLAVADIALVSLSPDGGGDGRLAVVDVSNPASPTNRNTILLPAGEGSPGTIQRRADGLLGLATSASVLLIDPAKLRLSAPSSGTHPAFVGRLELPAGGVRDFVADATGVNMIFSGGNRRIVQTAPRFQVVRFNQIVNPTSVATNTANGINALLRTATPVNLAEVTKVDFGSNAPPAMDPERHYYVVVDAPGGVGDKLPLALAAVDGRGQPQRDLNRGVVPVIVGDEAVAGALLAVRVTRLVRSAMKAFKAAQSGVGALQGEESLVVQLQRLLTSGSKVVNQLKKAIGELEKIFALFPKRFTAVRLSNNPDDPLYNRFLAGPFVVLGGMPREVEAKALIHQWADFKGGAPDSPIGQDTGLNRAYIRPSPRLWVGLPSLPETPLPGFGDPVLEPFHSKFRLHPTLNFSGITLPRVSSLVESLASDTVVLGPLALTLLDTLPVVNGEIQPTILPGAHHLVRVNFTERPLVFVPGFAGSSIEVEGNEFWLAITKIFNRTREELLMKPDGTPAFSSKAKDALRYTVELPVIGGLLSIYGTWLNHLADEVGYVEYDYLKPPPGQVFLGDLFERRRRLDQDPNLNQYPLPNLFVFPYDWRRDNQHSANLLKEYVRVVLEMHPDADGIDLVGHSNGGLVSRAYMLLPGQRQLVRRFISVGTPWLGAPKILAGLKTGDINELSLNAMLPMPALQATLQLSPGAHQLLPTREYFNLGFRPLVEDGFDINANRVSHEFYSFDQYMNAVEKDFLRKPLALLATNPIAMASNLTVHPAKANHLGFFASRPISDHRNEPAGAEFHHIFGFGAVPDTIGQVRVVGRLIPAEKTTNVTLELPASPAFESDQESSERLTSGKPGDGFLPITDRRFRLNEEIEVRFVCGDGTVPIASLTRGFGSTANLNAPQARVYPLIGAADEITGHNPMLNTDTFMELFDTLLVGRAVNQLQVSITVQGVLTEGSTGTLTVQANSGTGIGTDLVNVVVDFGDGGSEYRRVLSGSQVTLRHRYRQSGDYLVSVGALSDTGVSGFRSRQISVSNAPPQVSIQGGDITVNLGETRVFIADVSDPGLEDSHTFRWEGPDLSVDAGRQFAMPFTFHQPSNQTVKVIVTDSDGATNTAMVNVNVLATPPSGPSAPASPLEMFSAAAALNAFEGGQPELFVRVSGHAPGLLGTAGVSSRNSTITLLSSAADAVFDAAANAPQIAAAQQSLALLFNSIVLPRVARFLGLMADDTEYVRFVRSPPPPELLGVVPSQIAQVAAGGSGRPIEVDMLYLEGGVPKFLNRYSAIPSTNNGVRLTFNWVELSPMLEVIAPGAGGSLLNGTVVSNVPSRFDAFGEQKAGDRQGPVVVGIANAFSGRIELFSRDNFTAPTNIARLLTWDANGDGRLDDDIFYEIPTNTLERIRLPSRPFVIVGADEHCNVGDLIGFCPTFTGDFRYGERTGETNTYENRLTAVRSAVRGAINDARNSAAVRRFLIGPNPMWFLEQGSGAGLWKNDPVAACNGLYRPGYSDNDYEVFFPVHLVSNFTFTAASRAAFLSMNPYASATMSGDWYFVRPMPADGAGLPVATPDVALTWRYELPVPFMNGLGESFFLVDKLPAGTDPALGYPDPLTPAEAITRMLVYAATNHPSRRQLLPDINFFPERREHFMFGALHLQRPPLFGDDPIGDSGTGRQMLLLKWLLEGAYVTATDGGSPGTLSPGAPALSDVYQNWTQFGVPLAEGAEWGFFQEWAALMAKPLLDTRTRYSLAGVTEVDRCLDDAISATQKQKIKKLGKAAIRAALARLAGDPALSVQLTNITVQSYQTRNLRSFEDFILTTIVESGQAEEIFGAFAPPRDDLTEGPDLRDFLRAKNGDENYLSTVAFAPGAYQRFVHGVFEFLRTVQTATVPSFLSYTVERSQQGGFEEVGQRIGNLRAVLDGNLIRPGLRDLSTNPASERFSFFAAAANYADGPGGTVTVNLSSPPTPQPLAPAGAGIPDEFAAAGGNGGPVDSTTLDAREFDTLENTAVDFTLQGGSSSELTTTLEGAPVTELSTKDNEVVIEATPVSVPIEVPSFLTDFSVIFTEDGARYELLRDWPAANGRPNSARYLFTFRSRIQLLVFAEPGQSPLTATVRNVTRNEQFSVSLTAEPGSSVYKLPEPDGLISVTDDPLELGSLYIKDEDLVEFSVNGAPAFTKSYLVDRAEIATGGLRFSNRALGPEPRPTVHSTFTTARAFFSAGDQAFDDDIGGNNNPGELFANQFGSGSENSGEADFLYLLTHGYPDGTLRNHEDALGGSIWLDPVNLAVAAGVGSAFWTNDADVLLLHACFTLNTNRDFTSAPQHVQNALIRRGFNLFDVPSGAAQWRNVMTSSPRPVRMILAFDDLVTQRLAAELNFFSTLAGGQMPLAEAWSTAMSSGTRPWSMLVFSNNLTARLREMPQRPLPGDPILYLRSEIFAPDPPDEEEMFGPRPQTHLAESLRSSFEGRPTSLPRSISLHPLRLVPGGPWRWVGKSGDERWLRNVPAVKGTVTNVYAASTLVRQILRQSVPAGLTWRQEKAAPIWASWMAGDVSGEHHQAGCTVELEQTVHGVPVANAGVTAVIQQYLNSTVLLRGFELLGETAGQELAADAAIRQTATVAGLSGSARPTLKWVEARTFDKREPAGVFWPVWSFAERQTNVIGHPNHSVHVHAISGQLLEESK